MSKLLAISDSLFLLALYAKNIPKATSNKLTMINTYPYFSEPFTDTRSEGKT